MEIPSDFCEVCGELLELPLYGQEINCRKCGCVINLRDFVSKPIISEIIFQDKKEWIEDYKRSKGLIGIKEDKKRIKATIKQDCQFCGHHTLNYWTMQLRSADEGQTVFYECQKCFKTYQQNN